VATSHLHKNDIAENEPKIKHENNKFLWKVYSCKIATCRAGQYQKQNQEFMQYLYLKDNKCKIIKKKH